MTSLPAPVPGEQRRIRCESGELTVYIAGAGPPLLLVHSINASASAAEMLPLHRHFMQSRRVFCLDLPGYGLSERRDLPYSPQIMSEAIDATVRFIREVCSDSLVDAAALSLSCEYLAQSALRMASAYRSLAFISPTGFSGRATRRGPPGSNRGIAWLYRLLRGRSEGAFAFRQLTRPAVIRYFLGRTWGSKAIDEALWKYDILTTQQPMAQFAPLRFLSGYLFSGDIHCTYEALTLPVWMSHGTRGDFTDYRSRTIVQDHANWRFTIYPTGALPYFELPERFCADYADFLEAFDTPGSQRNGHAT